VPIETLKRTMPMASAILLPGLLFLLLGVSCTGGKASSDLAGNDRTKGSGDSGPGQKKDAGPVWPEHLKDFLLKGRAAYQIVNLFELPSFESPRLGYLVKGTVVNVGDPDFKTADCPEGWLELEQGGYSCRGRGLEADKGAPPRLNFIPHAPDIDASVPYNYGKVISDLTPIYKKIPSPDHVWRIPQPESPIDGGLSQDAGAGPKTLLTTREALLDAGIDPDKNAKRHGVLRLVDRGYWLSLDSKDRDFGTTYYRTIKGGFIEASKVTAIKTTKTKCAGVALDPARDDLTAALVFHKKGGLLYKTNPDGTRVIGVISRPPRLSAFSVFREKVLIGKRTFYRPSTLSQRLLLDSGLQVVEIQPLPKETAPGDKWIHVDLSKQVVTAYEGTRPVYAALVSTGKGKEGLETPSGDYRIQSKHVTKDMEGEAMLDLEEDAYLIEDVPYVQFIELSVALHGAFWHGAFGRPRSHGCINLAPEDARWLFRWTRPTLPTGWHGVFSTPSSPGTLVRITGKTEPLKSVPNKEKAAPP